MSEAIDKSERDLINKKSTRAPKVSSRKNKTSKLENHENIPNVIINETIENPSPKRYFDPDLYELSSIFNRSHPYFSAPHYLDLTTTPLEFLKKLYFETPQEDIKPIILYNCHKHPNFRPNLFSIEWLFSNQSDLSTEPIPKDKELKPMTLKNFLSAPKHSQPFQAEFISWPKEWQEAIFSFLPKYYLSSSCINLVNALPQMLRPETHRIQIHSKDSFKNSSLSYPIFYSLMVGSTPNSRTLWFVTAPQDANRARKFWFNHGGDNTSLDQENMFMDLGTLSLADFPIYVFEQQLGDLVIIPSNSAYQFVNVGEGYNVKATWYSIPTRALYTGITNTIPTFRKLLKPDPNQLAAIAHCSIVEMINDFFAMNSKSIPRRFEGDNYFNEEFTSLFHLYLDLVFHDIIDRHLDTPKLHFPKFKVADRGTLLSKCSFCQSGIWNRHIKCSRCERVFCFQCISMRRGCKHPNRNEAYHWVEYLPIKQCFRFIEDAANLYNANEAIKALPNFIELPVISTEKALLRFFQDKLPYATLAWRNLALLFSKEIVRCHQCKTQRYTVDTISCPQVKIPTHRSVCASCYSNRYCKNIFDLMILRTPPCNVCLNQCNCAECVRKRGEGLFHPKETLQIMDFNQIYELTPKLVYKIKNEETVYGNIFDWIYFTNVPLKARYLRNVTFPSQLTPTTSTPSSKPTSQTVKKKRIEPPIETKIISETTPIKSKWM